MLLEDTPIEVKDDLVSEILKSVPINGQKADERLLGQAMLLGWLENASDSSVRTVLGKQEAYRAFVQAVDGETAPNNLYFATLPLIALLPSRLLSSKLQVLHIHCMMY